jgi:hypothetical protein
MISISFNHPTPHPISHPTSHPTSHITHHTSHITHHTSHIPQHPTSHIRHHTSHIPHHTSHITHHTSHITHHTSHITHPTSHIHVHIRSWLVMFVSILFTRAILCISCKILVYITPRKDNVGEAGKWAIGPFDFSSFVSLPNPCSAALWWRVMASTTDIDTKKRVAVCASLLYCCYLNVARNVCTWSDVWLQREESSKVIINRKPPAKKHKPGMLQSGGGKRECIREWYFTVQRAPHILVIKHYDYACNPTRILH